MLAMAQSAIYLPSLGSNQMFYREVLAFDPQGSGLGVLRVEDEFFFESAATTALVVLSASCIRRHRGAWCPIKTSSNLGCGI